MSQISELAAHEPPTPYGGHEFSDYVLLGRNGKPTAVVEAKKSTKDAEIGREQAKQYCLNIQIEQGGDLNYAGRHEGYADLRATVARLQNLRLHVFGHIHTGHGVYKSGEATFVNAAVLTDDYAVRATPPLVFKYET